MPGEYSPQQAYSQPGSQPAPAPALPVAVWGATDKGRQREGNEDAVYPHSGSDTFPFRPGPDSLTKKGQLLVVADGVGGARAGSEASRWAIRVAVERYYDLTGPDLGTDLQTAVEVANASLYQYLQSTGATEAGSTMVAAVIHGNTLQVANVGDSRAYLIRNGQITQLTRDHTLTQQKLDRGLIQPEQAAMDPDSSVLTRSMGAGPTVQTDLFQPLQLTPGDVVLLCSDGLTDMLEDAQVARLMSGSSPKRTAQRLIAAANKRGGVDNISVIVAQVGGKPPKTTAGFLENIKRMSRTQKAILAGIAAALAMIVICWPAIWMAWEALGPRRTTPAPSATMTPTTAIATASPAATNTPPPTGTAPAGHPTSTPAPTLTPTPTPLPDADEDGIADFHDECPNLFGLHEFGGCPDDDGDGFPEREDGSGDECPGAPGPLNGCRDTDEDSVPDYRDNCPEASGPADNLGCPEFGGGGDDGGGKTPAPPPTNPPPPP